MELKTWFQCINPDCQSRYGLTDIVYRAGSVTNFWKCNMIWVC